MKIIILSTYYQLGGAELQALFEKNILARKKHNVKYVTFDPGLSLGEKKTCDHINIRGNYSSFNRRLRNAMIDYQLLKELRALFKKEQPDVIHLHNITYAFITIAIATKGFYTIQTLHDYSYVCPNDGRCLRGDFSLCKGYKLKDCLNDCYGASLKKKILMLYKSINRFRERVIRKKYVNKVVSPSEGLTNAVRSIGIEAQTINNTIDFSEFAGKTRINKATRKNVIFVGTVNIDKGIVQLLEAYDSHDYMNLNLQIIGKLGEGIEESWLRKKCQNTGAVYMGEMPYTQVIDTLFQSYALIIPSLRAENYPNTALEGMRAGCVVCGSNRGGIPELVQDKNLLFDVLSLADIKRCLKGIDEMDETRRDKVCQMQYDYLNSHNNSDLFIEKLLERL